jgi:predicted permease
VIAELALGMVLGAGAGLMVRSLARVSEVPLGFDPDRMLTVELSVPENEYPDAASYGAYFDRVVESVRTLPGSTVAATAAYLPLNHENPSTSVRLPGQPIADVAPSAERFAVSAGYFETMRIDIVAGRVFGVEDRSGAAPVAVINREFALRHFANRDALGATVLVGDAGREMRIIGVVEDVQHSSIMSPPPPQIYVSIAQFPARRRFLVTRASGDVAAFAASVRAAITDVDPDVPANRLRPMSAIMDESVGPFAAMSIVLGGFSVFALLLAAIGLYGLIAYSVAQRKAEFGVRMALGAGPRELMRVVLRDGARLALVGIALGLVGALATGQVLASLLYGVRPRDPTTLLSAALLFLFTALLATAIPALRASRSDPLVALRAD